MQRANHKANIYVKIFKILFINKYGLLLQTVDCFEELFIDNCGHCGHITLLYSLIITKKKIYIYKTLSFNYIAHTFGI